MDLAANIILIDSDLRRRASTCHALSSYQIHVEPFECISVLSLAWPRSGVIFIYDDPGRIDQLVRCMVANGEWLPFVDFHEAPSTRQIVQAISKGAIDYITWPFQQEVLAETLELAVSYRDRRGHVRLREIEAKSLVERLSAREREVLDCLADGLSNQLIAEKLIISPRTVEVHRAKMLTKLGVNRSAEAIRVAIEARLAE